MTSRAPFLCRAAAVLIASSAGMAVLPAAAHAESAAVEALIRQADYWRAKGRTDLAEDALKRARDLSPNSDAVRQAASRVRARPAPARAPAQAPATLRAEAAPPRASSGSAPAPARTASAPAYVDRAGNARAAGFDALDAGDLARAESQFTRALAANRSDSDAQGGLGLVRLRQQRFAEAADLLARAARGGKPGQWSESLASAQFFAGIADARALLAQGRTDEAQAEAEKLVRGTYAQPAPAIELLAEIYDRQGRYADSADLYRQAGDGGTQDDKRLQLRAARGRALAAVQRGDDTAAEREFQNGLLLDQNDPWIRYEFARYMIKRGRVSEYESLLRSLASSGLPDSLYAAALLDRDLGRSAAAEQLIDRIPTAQRTQPMRSLAVELKTDSAIARARAMADTGNRADAAAALRQLGATPGMPVSRQAAIADALIDLGDAASGAAIAEDALRQPIDQLSDYEGLIGALVRAGRDDLAGAALQRAGQLAGNSPEGQASYARMGAVLAVSQADRDRLAGRFADAFDTLQGAWNAAPDNPEVLRALARLYQSGNMSARAAQTFQLVLRKDPRDKDALLGLASAAQAAGDGALSEEAQRNALSAYPADYQVRMALADVERQRGDERAALKLLKEARELYARQQGTAPGLMSGNPFATADGAGANPFRNMAPPPQVNPFALGGGTRLENPAAYPPAAPIGGSYPAYQAAAFQPPAANMAQPPSWQAPAAPAFGGTAFASPAPSAPGQGGPAYSADPVMAKLQSDIASLSQDSGPRVDFDTSFRDRSGETGLSALSEIKGSAKFSTGLGSGRLYARADAVVIDSGRPTGSGLARFGRNGTPEAQAIVDEEPSVLSEAQTQHGSGVALAVGYQNELLKLEAGTTPVGMGDTKATFHAEVTPRLSETITVRAWAERQPVTDSVISYAGTRDPVTGERWGQVMRTTGGVAASWDRNGFGIYGDARYSRYEGLNVLDNTGVEVNVGGYMRAYRGARSSVTAGINLNYQAYDNNQNYFTFGHGGYFSPQNFLSIGFPLRYAMTDDRIELDASLTPGFQSYSQDQVVLYPTDPESQAVLDDLKGQNTDVRSFFDSLSKTGFAVSAEGSVYYRIAPGTRIGGQASYNSFGSYSEFRSTLGVRQSFGGDK